MPLFINVYDKVEGLTAEAVVEAHQHDRQAQSQHSVTFLKYWLDEGSGKVCCLVEAASQEAAEAVHREAHGGVTMVQIRPRQVRGVNFSRNGGSTTLGTRIRQD